MKFKVIFVVAAILIAVARPISAYADSSSDNQAICPEGFTPVAGTLDSESNRYVFHLSSGDVFRPVLNPETDFESLSQQEVMDLGLPPKPDSPDAVAGWLGSIQLLMQKSQNGYACDSGTSESVIAAGNHPIWSGILTTNSSTDYIGLKGEVVVPSRPSSVCSGATLTDWIGIGGLYTPRLLQVGIAYMPNSSTPIGFWEYLGDHIGVGMQPFAGFKMLARDKIYMYLVIQRSTGQTTFYLENITHPDVASQVTVLNVADYYDGSTAEWIDERLSYVNIATGASSPTSLIDFGTTSWSNMKAELLSGAYSNAGAETAHGMYMVNSQSQILAKPNGGLDTSTTFTDNFWKCQ